MNVGFKNATTPNFEGAKIFAIGAINNDKQNDIITVSDDQTSLMAHYFDLDSYMYRSSEPIKVNDCPFIS